MQFTGPDCYKYKINGLNLQKIHLNMYNISEDETHPPRMPGHFKRYSRCHELKSKNMFRTKKVEIHLISF